MFFKNYEGYDDPTAGIALMHIAREERMRKEHEQAAAQKFKMAEARREMFVHTMFAREDPMERIHDKLWLRGWTAMPAMESVTNVRKELTPKGISKRMTTREVKGEKDPWQALANAIIIRAVKDYRNRTRLMNRIKQRLKKDNKLTQEEREYLLQRYDYYERLQDDAGDFFFSDLFDVLCDLDGYDLLDRLNREVED